MHLHFLGIGGTFMSALAILAREAGFKVTGCDANCYPPVSELLKENEIEWLLGYDSSAYALQADKVIVGNAMKRGLPVIEAVMNRGKNYLSGPQWLAENILKNYRVMAVAGTHGKTTTTSMLAFILHYAGLKPGFLIGGVAPNFNTSARLGEGEWFVIEADEYDTAFFDKRPKFMHYQPEIAILNNLEFDHADIYPDLKAIQQQFHYYLKTLPPKGFVIKPRDDKALNAVLTQGIFCGLETLSLKEDADWQAELIETNGSAFKIFHQKSQVAEVHWPLVGSFNVENALAAVAASFRAGVSPLKAAEALMAFKPVKRRLELKAAIEDVAIYDDFAHHPTAIGKTIEALVDSKRHQRIFVVLEFASYTMRSGVHAGQMRAALKNIEGAFILKPEQFDILSLAQSWDCASEILDSTDDIVKAVSIKVKKGDAVLVMSNRGFEGIHQKLIDGISKALLPLGQMT